MFISSIRMLREHIIVLVLFRVKRKSLIYVASTDLEALTELFFWALSSCKS